MTAMSFLTEAHFTGKCCVGTNKQAPRDRASAAVAAIPAPCPPEFEGGDEAQNKVSYWTGPL